ncbi:hypothetical protein Q7P37_011180 [Cladosporium fusiforme]
MADQQNADLVYNAQLVRYFDALFSLHFAEYGTQDAFTLYHIVQEEAGKTSSIAGGPILPALGHAVAGSAATAATKLLLYPLDLVITRLQVQKQLSGPKEAPSAAKDGDAEYENVVDAARKIYDTEGGLKAFYTGLGPDVLKGLGDSFLFFLVYNFLRQRETKKFSNNLPVSRELGIGIAAGALSRFVTTPLQNIITRQQTAALIAARDPTSTTTPSQSTGLTVKDIAMQIRSERGLKGFWAGYSASVVLTLNPAITFAVDNLLHNLIPRAKRDKPAPQLTFLIAATSKAIATAITYPVSLAKSRAQVSAPTDTEVTEKSDTNLPSTLDQPRLHNTPTRRKLTDNLKKLLRLLSAQYAILVSLRKVYQSEGLGGLYSGLEAEVLKGFLSHGLTMVMKDRVHVGVIQLYYVLLKVTRRWPAELQKAQETATHALEDAKEKVQDSTSHAIEDVREKAESVAASGRHVVWGGEKKE